MSDKFVATNEQMRTDPLLASAHAAGLTEREVIDLMINARRDTVKMVERILLSMHSVSMFVCQSCKTRIVYTGPTAADLFKSQGKPNGT